MRTPVRAAAAVSVVLLSLLALRWSTQPSSVAAEEGLAETEDRAASPRIASGPAPRDPGERPIAPSSDSVAAMSERTESETDSDPRLPPRFDLEDESPLLDLRRAFDAEPVSASETRAQRAWVESTLAEHDVETLYVEVECTSQLCRAELGFESVWQFRDLGRIALPEDLSHYTSPLVRRSDRPGLGLLVYWGVGGHDLTTLLDPAPSAG